MLNTYFLNCYIFKKYQWLWSKSGRKINFTFECLKTAFNIKQLILWVALSNRSDALKFLVYTAYCSLQEFKRWPIYVKIEKSIYFMNSHCHLIIGHCHLASLHGGSLEITKKDDSCHTYLASSDVSSKVLMTSRPMLSRKSRSLYLKIRVI